MNAVFSIPIRVYYEDTDTGGVVYHSNYLNFMERARSEWLRDLGFEQDELIRTDGVIFAVSAVNVSFHRPARFNDLLSVGVRLTRRGAASLMLEQDVRRGEELLASGEVRIACLDNQRFAPVAIPARIVDQVVAVYGDRPARRKTQETREKP